MLALRVGKGDRVDEVTHGLQLGQVGQVGVDAERVLGIKSDSDLSEVRRGDGSPRHGRGRAVDLVAARVRVRHSAAAVGVVRHRGGDALVRAAPVQGLLCRPERQYTLVGHDTEDLGLRSRQRNP